MNRTQTTVGALALFSIVGLATAEHPTRYHVVPLGSIPSSNICPCFFPQGVDDVGGVSGMFFNASGFRHTFYWDGDSMIDIGTLGGEDAVPRGMGPDGSIVGYSDTGGNPQCAFYYKDGVMTDLGTLGGVFSVANAANAFGQVVGNANRPEPDYYYHAFLWQNGEMTDLEAFGGEFSSAEGINDYGEVVGWAWDADRDRHAFLWTQHAGLTDLGLFGGIGSNAVDINNAGQVVVQVLTANSEQKAYLWQAGSSMDLGRLSNAGIDPSNYGTPSLVNTIPSDINNYGQIVGTADPEPADSLPGPFIWQNGQISNLNDLIDLSAGWVIRYATSINDAGEIVATARLDGQGSYAVMLTPYCVVDLAPPQGVLDFTDVTLFLAAFAAQEFDADLAPPIGVHDFSDIVAFLSVFAGGCQ